MQTSVFENATNYVIKIVIGDYKFITTWGKDPISGGQTREEYLQACKREAELLAQYENERLAETVLLLI